MRFLSSSSTTFLPLSLSLALTSLFASITLAQDDDSSISYPHGNATSLSGQWSSGTGAVGTGPDFINPINFTFHQPPNTGISYSFTDDGFFEESQFRFFANATKPNCAKAVLIWQHGTYTINSNQSLSLQPFPTDGRVQVSDPCAHTTTLVYYMNQPELYNGWTITNDLNHNAWMLQLYGWDGSPMPRLYLRYNPANMWPTAQLTTNSTLQQQSDINTYGINGGTNNGAAPS